MPSDIELIESFPGKIEDDALAIVVVGRTAEEAAEWARRKLGKAHYWLAVDTDYSLEGVRCVQVFYLNDIAGEVTAVSAENAVGSIILSTAGAIVPELVLQRIEFQRIQNAGYREGDWDF